jgi:hypothetical protein
MNLGQMLITIGMFVLLMVTVISANRVLVDNAETAAQTDPLTPASVLANDLLADIMSKPFDQRVIDSTGTQDKTGIKIFTADSLSLYQGVRWGVRNLLTLPDTSSTGKYLSRTLLKDIDDYDGYSRMARIAIRPGDTLTYTVSVNVYYVAYTAPDVLTTTRQFFKKIEVTVVEPTYKVRQVYSAVASY